MDSDVARILDANANRAREAFRVLEEFARFSLDDRWLSSRIKSLRHELAQSLADFDGGQLIRARNIASDVGRSIETETEYARGSVGDVAIAAAKRAAEALRVLEEYTKTMGSDRPRRFEKLRYELYEIERAVAIRTSARERFAEVDLYVLITESLCHGPWLETAKRVIDGGTDCIQLREKSLSDAELLERTRALAGLCRDAGILFIVNDRPDMARLGGADGVHVGQGDMSVSDARRIVGPSGLVGVSTHTLDQSQAAIVASPDYVAVGPMFMTDTKPRNRIPGPSLLADVCGQTSLPIVPIGGINEGNLATVLEAGARRVCVCSAVISSSDVTSAARWFKDRMTSAVENRGPDHLRDNSGVNSARSH